MAGSPPNLHTMVLSPHPGCAQGLDLEHILDADSGPSCFTLQWSKVTWYGYFCDFTKIASSRRLMALSPPNLYMMVPRRACIHDVLKVKGHVIQTLLWCHEMFAIQHGLTFCLYMRSLFEAPLYSPSSISIRQLDLMSKYWNELLRHWRSSFTLNSVLAQVGLRLYGLEFLHGFF